MEMGFPARKLRHAELRHLSTSRLTFFFFFNMLMHFKKKAYYGEFQTYTKEAEQCCGPDSYIQLQVGSFLRFFFFRQNLHTLKFTCSLKYLNEEVIFL